MSMARKYRQGTFKPTNPHKYVGDINNIVYRSSWEHKFMQQCDLNPAVKRFSSEELAIPYWSEFDQKYRRYFIDFVITVAMKDGSEKTFLIEIKPYCQTIPPKVTRRKKPETMLQEAKDWAVNNNKWQAAKIYADKIGAECRVLDEYSLAIKRR